MSDRMTVLDLHNTYGLVLWEMRLITWLQGVVLILAAAALIKYLFFR